MSKAAKADAEAGRKRCGFVALIGAPNAGKSTLVNRLVGSKISIVTHKVQTTRARLRGIVVEGESQLVLVDTPGIFAPRRRLDRAMVQAAWGGAQDADIVALIVDAARGIDEDVERILSQLEKVDHPRLLILNKIDKIKKEALLALAAAINERVSFGQTFMISALSGSGVADLLRHLGGAVPAGPWHYPEDQMTDAPLRHTAAEITREKLYLRLHDELPYSSTVETTSWKQMKDASVRIEQTIFVERESQRRIVLGHKGETIKSISIDSRKELAEIIEQPVHLFLFVKVRERWGDDREHYEEMGLEFPDE